MQGTSSCRELQCALHEGIAAGKRENGKVVLCGQPFLLPLVTDVVGEKFDPVAGSL